MQMRMIRNNIYNLSQENLTQVNFHSEISKKTIKNGSNTRRNPAFDSN